MPGFNRVTVPSPTAIANGGTGATTTAGARTALGAASVAATNNFSAQQNFTYGGISVSGYGGSYMLVGNNGLGNILSSSGGGTTFQITSPGLGIFLPVNGTTVEINNGTTGVTRDVSLRSLFASAPSKLGSYTVATLPSASSYSGYATTVSNPASGKRGDVLSNGANWLYSDNSIAV